MDGNIVMSTVPRPWIKPQETTFIGDVDRED
jgi:hypothetical protein